MNKKADFYAEGIEVSQKDYRIGAILAGNIPNGAEVDGLVYRNGSMSGGYVRLANGQKVEIANGVIKQLPDMTSSFADFFGF